MNKRSHVLYIEKSIWIFLVSVCMFLGYSCKNKNVETLKSEVNSKPKIVNIVNFIRLLEPRDVNITEDVLYQTVVNQVSMMKKYNLGGTFLLQYDALMDSRYQELLKELPRDAFEVGAWWEIPQPMAEKAGLNWRGRFPWDWHADVGFSTGYTPEEREKLADVYMNDFKEIFGYYPKSVASWFIDAHTLNYLYKKYHIVASANCKDQYGTDGYTMWGGYWNQAYYPSKINSYMPAQNKENQIPVPIFRMLGSDPLRQYDTGLGHTIQGVITLEPVYPDAGGDANWVKWYLDQFIEGESMEYAYTQAGQENSFTWNGMKKGFEIQLPLISKLRDENKVKVETLEESGRWFKNNYDVTPATSVTVNNSNGALLNDNRKTVWFNSRFYRANLLWDKDGTLKFRDIHLFDERLKSSYFDKKLESNQALFFTLPLVDGYLWSTPEEIAGLRFKGLINGKETFLEGGSPTITNPTKGKLAISWPLTNTEGSILMEFDERKVTITHDGSNEINWFLDLTASKSLEELPFISIKTNIINSKFENINYSIEAEKGGFSTPNNTIFRISPKENTIVLNLSSRD
ncbi:hypothetical protein [Flavivirga sp. 57AJ16]|uniref:hypothetical protein n=1 Tax=Flavivirga sp. 57AJ16 TaxID=3025307 RepID=UPI002365E691|nr:hypothetical protein [Flavivirga sp. 57AJ16]MDD7885137.1 hypothetical protein [Flavivirga sp. 57AJ16]